MADKKEFIQKINDVQHRLKAPKNQRNDFGEFLYRSAEDIESAAKPLLLENDLLLTLSDEFVPLVGHEDPGHIKATASITDGVHTVEVSAYAREQNVKKRLDSSQITGSASSYARKYALCGLFLIDDTKDADSYDNSEPAKPKKETAKTPEPKPDEGKEETVEGGRVSLEAIHTILDEVKKLDDSQKEKFRHFLDDNGFTFGKKKGEELVGWNIRYKDLSPIMRTISELGEPL